MSTKPHEECLEPFSFFKPEHEKEKTMLKLDFMFESGTKPVTKPENPISDLCCPRCEMDVKFAWGLPILDRPPQVHLCHVCTQGLDHPL